MHDAAAGEGNSRKGLHGGVARPKSKPHLDGHHAALRVGARVRELSTVRRKTDLGRLDEGVYSQGWR